MIGALTGVPAQMEQLWQTQARKGFHPQRHGLPVANTHSDRRAVQQLFLELGIAGSSVDTCPAPDQASRDPSNAARCSAVAGAW